MTPPPPTPADIAAMDLPALLRTIHGLGWAGGISGSYFEGEYDPPSVWITSPDPHRGWMSDGSACESELMTDDPTEQLRAMLARLVVREMERRAEGEDG